MGVGAMLLALLTSPFLHFHDRDDHGNPASLVHAHSLESEGSHPHSGDEIENPHSHDHARWVEFFTFTPPTAGFDLAIGFAGPVSLPLLEERRNIIISAETRSHSPPVTRRSRPRSPPSI